MMPMIYEYLATHYAYDNHGFGLIQCRHVSAIREFLRPRRREMTNFMHDDAASLSTAAA